MKIPFREMIDEGNIIPWWKGIAYRDYARATAVVYPVPWHHVVKYTRWFWYRICVGRHKEPQWFGRMINEVKENSYIRGELDGYKKGYKDGLKDSQDTIDACKFVACLTQEGIAR
jgi:hypothetical protein